MDIVQLPRYPFKRKILQISFAPTKLYWNKFFGKGLQELYLNFSMRIYLIKEPNFIFLLLFRVFADITQKIIILSINGLYSYLKILWRQLTVSLWILKDFEKERKGQESRPSPKLKQSGARAETIFQNPPWTRNNTHIYNSALAPLCLANKKKERNQLLLARESAVTNQGISCY